MGDAEPMKIRDILLSQLAEAEKNFENGNVNKILNLASIHYDFLFLNAEIDDTEKIHI